MQAHEKYKIGITENYKIKIHSKTKEKPTKKKQIQGRRAIKKACLCRVGF